jgi:hypothetical protein
MLRRVELKKLIGVSKVLTVSIIPMMMKAASNSETSVNFYETTRRNIPEDSQLHTDEPFDFVTARYFPTT